MNELCEVGEFLADCYILTLAKGGYNVEYGRKTFEYSIRKEREGRRVWSDMTAEEQEARKNEALVICECNNDLGSDPYCEMCKGEGKRHMTTKERDVLEWKVRQWEDQEKREHCGDGNWCEYVMRSTDKMAKDGCWQNPYETDGYHLEKARRKTPLPTTTVRAAVKVYHKDVLVGIVDKEVKISIDKNKIPEKWKPLWKLLIERQEELQAEREVFLDTGILDRVKKKILLLNAVQNVLARSGNCKKGAFMVESVLRREQFEEVAHLWAEESAREAVKAVTEAQETQSIASKVGGGS